MKKQEKLKKDEKIKSVQKIKHEKPDENLKPEESSKKPEDSKKTPSELDEISKQDSKPKIKASKQLSEEKNLKTSESQPKKDSFKPKDDFSKEDSKTTPSDIKALLDHLAFRMQINRLPKSKLYVSLFKNIPADKPISKQEFQSCLKSPPFNFTSEESESLSLHLLESSKSPAKTIEKNLSKILDD